VDYLVSTQSHDGAWRSDVRGAFREGDALTPLVLRALREIPEDLQPRGTIGRGLNWMRYLARRVEAAPEPWSEVRYPLFTACHAARLGDQAGSSGLWTGLLHRLQLSGGLGWPERDPRAGGWSDAAAPVRFTGPQELADMNNPNISATACALDGLAGAAHSEIRRDAHAFIGHCQNFPSDSAPDDELEDGGFFFALDDPIRNKAGAAGNERNGRCRFRSYGSATCDGLFALVACGLPAQHPRIHAAAGWLRRHAGGSPHPGDWPPGRRAGAAGLEFYFAQAYARSLRWIRASMPSLRDWSREQRKLLTASLLARQSGDGSWVNPEPESFEDDPLLATAFALRALSARID